MNGIRWLFLSSRKNIRNQGNRFLRKVPKSEEGLTRKSRINVAKTYVVKAASLNEACIRLPQLLSINEDISNLEFPLINWSQ